MVYFDAAKGGKINGPKRKKFKGGRALMFKGGISKLIQKFKGKAKDKKAGNKIYGVGGEEIDVADFKKSLGLDKPLTKKVWKI